ncbi:hypothetical protein ACFX2J_002394 [Malus domestica]
MVDRSNFFFDFESIYGRRNAYRAIVHARPPHLNNIYLATQVFTMLFQKEWNVVSVCVCGSSLNSQNSTV